MGGEPSVGWRLIGSNHRELGRSAETFAGFEECRAAVQRLRERIADARMLLTTSEGAGGWSWRLEIDGQAVAVAGRPYQRQRDCQYNVGQFLNAVPVAELTEPTAHAPRGTGGSRPHESGQASGDRSGPAKAGLSRAEPDGAGRARSGEDDGTDAPDRAGVSVR
ncbi:MULTISPECIES: hypothetical protein [unclassified Streptomyces]|uniref:hypothetical protein n=1 Tax=unclassified Streptomyces TaxID=2593676 RepID=UPI003D901D40